MTYLLGQILFCLFFAAMTGFAVGWLFRGAPPSRPSRRPVHESPQPAPSSAADDSGSLREENSALRARLETGMGRLRQIEQDLSAQAESASQRVAQERERADSLQASLHSTQTELAEKARALASRDALLAKQSETLQSLERRLSSNAEVIKTASEITARQTTEAQSAQSAHRIAEQVQAMDVRLRDYDEQCSRQDQQIERLGKNIAAVTEQAINMRAQLSGARQRLAQAQSQEQSDQALASRLASAREQLSKMQNEVLERDQVIASLRQRLQHTPVQQDLPITNPDLGGHPAWLLQAPDGERDDLKRIYGIGPVLERTLNELGVFHFRQIASLSAADVAWLAAHVNSFPDRIIRDQWVEQAQELIGAG